MSSITTLLQHGDHRIREIGQKAVQYKGQLERQEISVKEYEDLCAQLLDLKKLDAAAGTAEADQELAEIAQFAAAFLKVVL